MEILTLVPDAVETDMIAGYYEFAGVGDSETARAGGFAKVAGFVEVAVPVVVGLPALPEPGAESGLAHSRGSERISIFTGAC